MTISNVINIRFIQYTKTEFCTLCCLEMETEPEFEMSYSLFFWYRKVHESIWDILV